MYLRKEWMKCLTHKRNLFMTILIALKRNKVLLLDLVLRKVNPKSLEYTNSYRVPCKHESNLQQLPSVHYSTWRSSKRSHTFSREMQSYLSKLPCFSQILALPSCFSITHPTMHTTPATVYPENVIKSKVICTTKFIKIMILYYVKFGQLIKFF